MTLPLLSLACVPVIRPLKGLFIASQYINKAGEGRLAPSPAPDTGPTTRG